MDSKWLKFSPLLYSIVTTELNPKCVIEMPDMEDPLILPFFPPTLATWPVWGEEFHPNMAILEHWKFPGSTTPDLLMSLRSDIITLRTSKATLAVTQTLWCWGWKYHKVLAKCQSVTLKVATWWHHFQMMSSWWTCMQRSLRQPGNLHWATRLDLATWVCNCHKVTWQIWVEVWVSHFPAQD